jgi:hypothetical protein
MLEEQNHHRMHQERMDLAPTMRIPTNKQGNHTNTLIMCPPNLMGLVPQAPPVTRHTKSTCHHHLIYLVHTNIQSLLLQKQSRRIHQERMDQAPTMRIPTTINKQGIHTNNLMLRPPNLMGLMPQAPATRHTKSTFHHLIYLVHISMQSLMLEEQNNHRLHQERTDQAFTMRIPTNGQGNCTKHLIMRPPNLVGRLGRRTMGILVGTCTKQRNLRIMFTLVFPAHCQAMSKIQRRTISNAIQYHQALNYIRIRTKFPIRIPKPLLVRMKVLDHRSILLTTFLLRHSHNQRITNTRLIVTIQLSLVTSTYYLRGVDGEPATSTCHVYKARLLATTSVSKF